MVLPIFHRGCITLKPLLTLDFETDAIERRPVYPPKPTSYAYKLGSDKGFVSWALGSENNTTLELGRKKLATLFSKASGVICHNTIFDRDVCQTHLGMDHDGPWHDTKILAFLKDPYGNLSLKPLSERYLDMPPEEQDAVRNWLVRAGIVRSNQKDWGAHISKAPGSIVGPYAIGDVERTEKLFKFFGNLSNSEAYQRELKVTPIVLDMERRGVRLDMVKLERDTNATFMAVEKLDAAIRRKLGDIDVDNDAQMADALEAKGKLAAPLPLTEKGSRSVNKVALQECVNDNQLLGNILLRNALATCVRTFMHPWLQQGYRNNGRMFFQFNQVKGEGVGAKTGRMSSSPNMMNVPSKWEALLGIFQRIGYKPKFKLPNVREYLLPDEGDVLVSLDYSQQAMRLFAHFEDGALMQAYRKNPKIDAHAMVAELSGLSRKAAKTLNFAALYGAGLGVVMEWLDCTHEEASAFRRQYRNALPGVKELNDSILAEVAAGKPITTIGGREYYPEPPKYIKGVLRSFEYKLLNYLMQGSAADQTKQAVVDYYAPGSGRKGRLMFPVHDELVISVPRAHATREAKLLSKLMAQSFQESLDVKFLVDMEIGENYGEV